MYLNDAKIEDVVGSVITVGTDMTAGEYAEEKGGKVWVDLIETAEGNSTSWCGNLEQVDALIEALQTARKEATESSSSRREDVATVGHIPLRSQDRQYRGSDRYRL